MDDDVIKMMNDLFFFPKELDVRSLQELRAITQFISLHYDLIFPNINEMETGAQLFSAISDIVDKAISMSGIGNEINDLSKQLETVTKYTNGNTLIGHVLKQLNEILDIIVETSKSLDVDQSDVDRKVNDIKDSKAFTSPNLGLFLIPFLEIEARNRNKTGKDIYNSSLYKTIYKFLINFQRFFGSTRLLKESNHTTDKELVSAAVDSCIESSNILLRYIPSLINELDNLGHEFEKIFFSPLTQFETIQVFIERELDEITEPDIDSSFVKELQAITNFPTYPKNILIRICFEYLDIPKYEEELFLTDQSISSPGSYLALLALLMVQHFYPEVKVDDRGFYHQKGFLKIGKEYISENELFKMTSNLDSSPERTILGKFKSRLNEVTPEDVVFYHMKKSRNS